MMYATFEEEHGLIKRSMAIYDRATKVVADADKFEVCVNPFLMMFLLIHSYTIVSAIHYLHRKSNRELRSTCNPSNIRTRARDPP